MNTPTLTKERIYINYPDYYGMETILRHIARYKWAMSNLKSGSTVLDVACGTGYGAYILLNRAKHVMGIDIASEAIAFAEQKRIEMRNENIQYITCDATSLNLDQKFDAVVCIEMIEHLMLLEQDKFMRQLSCLLKSDGKLLMTTPIRNEKPMTEYHKHEFHEPEFIAFLRQYFEKVEFDNPEDFKIPKTFMLAKCESVFQ